MNEANVLLIIFVFGVITSIFLLAFFIDKIERAIIKKYNIISDDFWLSFCLLSCIISVLLAIYCKTKLAKIGVLDDGFVFFGGSFILLCVCALCTLCGIIYHTIHGYAEKKQRE